MKRLTKKQVYTELRCLHAAMAINGVGGTIIIRRKSMQALLQAWQSLKKEAWK